MKKLIAFLVTVIFSSNIFACSCGGSATLESSYEHYPFVAVVELQSLQLETEERESLNLKTDRWNTSVEKYVVGQN
ncbi:hypothetical protein [Thalassotalea sp. Y01]|uniref:hypothetical protein n=1 Tax=Thalassotalea sp. Y01 TaxID=2729613 RepID=UPI00145E5324|nr:hypothetical protein [Thalassotalea sp. Y01]NMP16008.1 hypothetical protein [Thalassotalea sp. Y01]